jgi:hypothetical protein
VKVHLLGRRDQHAIGRAVQRVKCVQALGVVTKAAAWSCGAARRRGLAQRPRRRARRLVGEDWRNDRVGGRGATCRDVDELEINPLLVTPAGAVALDARVVRRRI